MSRTHVDGGLLASLPSAVVLGIDPSLTGFAVTALGTYTGKFESWVYTSPHRGVVRLDDISKWLGSKTADLAMAGHDIRNIAIEDGVHLSHAAAVLGELSGAVRLYLYRAFPGSSCRYPLRVPPSMVKKYATDNGTARKNEVMLGVYKRWGVEMSNDNMADSFVIAHIAAGLCTTKYQQDVLAKLEDPKFRDQPPVV